MSICDFFSSRCSRSKDIPTNELSDETICLITRDTIEELIKKGKRVVVLLPDLRVYSYEGLLEYVFRELTKKSRASNQAGNDSGDEQDESPVILSPCKNPLTEVTACQRIQQIAVPLGIFVFLYVILIGIKSYEETTSISSRPGTELEPDPILKTVLTTLALLEFLTLIVLAWSMFPSKRKEAALLLEGQIIDYQEYKTNQEMSETNHLHAS